ncbi:MAG: hypothetical protein M3Y37_11565 [Chloroflexota bacterium]|nr:hypothetical protein [Chloroflexota bacterium]
MSRLRLDGEGGTVVLVASDSGAIVARQRVDLGANTSNGPLPHRDIRQAYDRLAALWLAPKAESPDSERISA